MQDFRYDLRLDDAGADAGTLRGTVVNRSGAAWERGEGRGELKLGWRITAGADDAAVLEGRGDPLPVSLLPGETVPFTAAVDVQGLDPGRYRIEIGLLREHLYWFHVHGVPSYRSELIVLTPPAPATAAVAARATPMLHPAPAHPYAGLPAYRFWSRGVARQPAGRLGPMADPPFAIRPGDRVSTAGSCFAQHIARRLRTRFRFVEAEPPVADTDGFSANYGNIYTARQLHQLLLRAYGLLRPRDVAWRRADGRFIDPFRPQLFPDGFDSADAVADARDAHLNRVRRVFEDSDVFVFTLGLTEAWVNEDDGAVLPVPPGVVAASAGRGPYGFVNFTADEVAADLAAFIAAARLVNPGLRIVLTVSPVPLVATGRDSHVLSANGYSKAALRVAAERMVAAHDDVAYFPSFELVTSPAVRGAWYAADQRSVTAEGVGHVMDAFAHAFLRDAAAPAPSLPPPPEPALSDTAWQQDRASLRAVICDEELLDGTAPGA